MSCQPGMARHAHKRAFCAPFLRTGKSHCAIHRNRNSLQELALQHREQLHVVVAMLHTRYLPGCLLVKQTPDCIRLCTAAVRWERTSSCCFCLSIGRCFAACTAARSAVSKLSGVGSASCRMCAGRTSGTPPTFVDTTSRPHEAASTIAMQNASVRLVFRKMSPAQAISSAQAMRNEDNATTG